MKHIRTVDSFKVPEISGDSCGFSAIWSHSLDENEIVEMIVGKVYKTSSQVSSQE